MASGFNQQHKQNTNPTSNQKKFSLRSVTATAFFLK